MITDSPCTPHMGKFELLGSNSPNTRLHILLCKQLVNVMENDNILHVTTTVYTGYMFKSRYLVRAQTSVYFIL